MMRAVRLATAVLGVYAGLLGAAHGFFEIQQGSAAPPSGVLINAIGPPCQPEAISHACFPAMTLIPDFRVTGVLAILFAAAIVVWAVAFVERSPLVLAGLGVGLLLTGGGFLAPFYTLIAAGAATRIDDPLRLPAWLGHPLAALWPWVGVVYFMWIGVQLALTGILNDFLLGLGGVLFPLEIIMLLVTVAAALAYDGH